jgi:ligand-binding SRPBCC domain-containing protein
MPIDIQKGKLIDYRLRLRFVPIRWRTLISDWTPNRQFVDEQLKGPYRLWRHSHQFEECEGGTLVRDTVQYRVLGGKMIERLFVRRDLRRIFEYRYNQLAAIFAAGEAQS